MKLAHRILHRALADAVRWNLIAANPATGVRAPRGEPTEMTVWTAEEAKRFLDAMAEDRLIALWTVALHTGLRRGELAGLRWTDIDLKSATLTVAQQRTTANHQVVITTPKAKSQRQLLLAPATVATLRGPVGPGVEGAVEASGVGELSFGYASALFDLAEVVGGAGDGVVVGCAAWFEVGESSRGPTRIGAQSAPVPSRLRS